ncbi:MAG TPA: hypothetical protein PK480_11160 [Candidatus Hydrogenedentes bacterium]|nr:hypothetical protein [Candidatus Hydrogenedentota bacterium]
MVAKRTLVFLIACTSALLPYASMLWCACAEDCLHCTETVHNCHAPEATPEHTGGSCCDSKMPSADSVPADTDYEGRPVAGTQCACGHGSTETNWLATIPATRKSQINNLTTITSPPVADPSTHMVSGVSESPRPVHTASAPHVLHCVFLC